ncbi:unnamed protein product [Lampetra planeri]
MTLRDLRSRADWRAAREELPPTPSPPRPPPPPPPQPPRVLSKPAAAQRSAKQSARGRRAGPGGERSIGNPRRRIRIWRRRSPTHVAPSLTVRSHAGQARRPHGADDGRENISASHLHGGQETLGSAHGQETERALGERLACSKAARHEEEEDPRRCLAGKKACGGQRARGRPIKGGTPQTTGAAIASRAVVCTADAVFPVLLLTHSAPVTCKPTSREQAAEIQGGHTITAGKHSGADAHGVRRMHGLFDQSRLFSPRYKQALNRPSIARERRNVTERRRVSQREKLHTPEPSEQLPRAPGDTERSARKARGKAKAGTDSRRMDEECCARAEERE